MTSSGKFFEMNEITNRIVLHKFWILDLIKIKLKWAWVWIWLSVGNSTRLQKEDGMECSV